MSTPDNPVQSVQQDVPQLGTGFRDFVTAEYPRWKKLTLHRLRGSLARDADDVVQAAAEQLFRKWDAISALSDTGRRAFAMKVLRDQIATAQRTGLRDERRRTGSQPGEELAQPATCDTETQVQLRRLAEAMDTLRAAYPQWAEVVSQRQVGTSYEDIAVLMSIATSTAKNHYSMGVRYLQRLINSTAGSDPDGEE